MHEPISFHVRLKYAEEFDPSSATFDLTLSRKAVGGYSRSFGTMNVHKLRHTENAFALIDATVLGIVIHSRAL